MSLKTKLFIAFMLAVSVVEAALGLWQWQRRSEKAEFVAAMARASEAPPRDFDGAPLWSRITLTGRYLHQHTTFVRTSRKLKSESQFGVLVMTPLVTRVCTKEGRCSLTTVYVNRGFLPTTPDGKIPAHERPEEPVTLTGILRAEERPSLLQPGNDAARKVWFSREVSAMARAAGLPGADSPATYDRFVDREAAGGESPPFGLDARALIAGIPDNHFTYAMTWWGLMLTNLIVLGFFLARARGGAAPRSAVR